MNLRNYTVGARLTTGFTLLILFILLLIADSLVEGAKNRSALYAALGGVSDKVTMAQQLRFDAAEENAMLQHIAAHPQNTPDADVTARLNALSQALSQVTNSLRQDEQAAQNKALLDEIAQRTSALDQLRTAASGSDQAAVESLAQQFPAMRHAQMTALENYVALLLQEQKDLPQLTETAFRKKAYATVSVVVALIIVIGLLLARLLTRSVTLPLRDASAIAHKIADGELGLQIDTAGKDELADLMRAIRNMDRALSATVGQVRSATDVISVGASEIARGNTDLSSRTETQASSLEETASSLEELTATVQQNAENAQHANQLVLGAAQVAKKGGAVVGEVVNTMVSIKESSNRIVDIISVIDGLAFQTNILALNAAVEAARAGDQGRGFAVVAAEVRNLAQRSAAAAKEIKTLIADSVNKVEEGAKLVDQAGLTMDEIVKAVGRTTNIMGEIAAASREQSAGIMEVNKAVVQMDEMTQQNAALVEQAAAAAQSMDEQAQKLLVAVSVFNIRDDTVRKRQVLRLTLRCE